MGLPSSGNITLSAIEAETGTSSLNAAGVVAGFTAGGTAMTEFYGWSAVDFSNTYYQFQTDYDSWAQEWYSVAYFRWDVRNIRANSYWYYRQYPGTNTGHLYPWNWNGDVGVDGYADSSGSIYMYITGDPYPFWAPGYNNICKLWYRDTNNNLQVIEASITSNLTNYVSLSPRIYWTNNLI